MKWLTGRWGMGLGMGWMTLVVVATACGAPAVQQEHDAGRDGDPCSGSQTRCEGQSYQVCDRGIFVESATCPAHQVCVVDLGCAECDPQYSQYCSGDSIYECREDATQGVFVIECGMESCSDGQCTDACSAAELRRSYIGCEYWPVDLDNAIEVLGGPDAEQCVNGTAAVRNDLALCYNGLSNAGLCDYGGSCPAGYTCQVTPACVLDAQGSRFAVVAANPDATSPVLVTLENSGGVIHSETIEAGGVATLYPSDLGFPEQSLDYSSVESKAYRLTSSAPIVAYQFNPLDDEDVFSNDGSLLIPRHAYDTLYFAITTPTLVRRPLKNDYSGYVTVVASAVGTTQVEVTPTAPVRAGLGVAAMQPGASATFELQQFEVLNLEAAAGGDLTGTLIQALPGSSPFGVFVGHEAAVISNQVPAPCCADHLEEQLFPASSWGKEYAVARTYQRAGEQDRLNILAQRPNTEITFDPEPMSGTCASLGAGQACEVYIDEDTVVRANEPILVAHYMLSVAGLGDPSMAIAVPFEQYRTDYTFLLPQEYTRQYISVVVPAGGSFTLDGIDFTHLLSPFGSDAFLGGRLNVTPGLHKIDCEPTCGFEAYGYSNSVSFLFAGGLDLNRLVVE